MEKQLVFYLAGLAGILVHFVLQMRDASTKSEVFNWKKQLTNSVYIVVLTAVLIAFRLDMVSMLSKVGFDISDLADNKLLWFFVGYFADSVWKNVEKTGRTILKTDEEVQP